MTKKCVLYFISLPKIQTLYFALYIIKLSNSISQAGNPRIVHWCRALIFGCWFPLAVKISLGDFSSQGKHATKNTKSVRLEVQSRFEVMKQLYSLAQASLLHDWSLRLSYLCIVLVSVQELLMHIVLFLPSSLTGLMDRLRKTSATINISLV